MTVTWQSLGVMFAGAAITVAILAMARVFWRGTARLAPATCVRCRYSIGPTKNGALAFERCPECGVACDETHLAWLTWRSGWVRQAASVLVLLALTCALALAAASWWHWEYLSARDGGIWTEWRPAAAARCAIGGGERAWDAELAILNAAAAATCQADDEDARAWCDDAWDVLDASELDRTRLPRVMLDLALEQWGRGRIDETTCERACRAAIEASVVLPRRATAGEPCRARLLLDDTQDERIESVRFGDASPLEVEGEIVTAPKTVGTTVVSVDVAVPRLNAADDGSFTEVTRTVTIRRAIEIVAPGVPIAFATHADELRPSSPRFRGTLVRVGERWVLHVPSIGRPRGLACRGAWLARAPGAECPLVAEYVELPAEDWVELDGLTGPFAGSPPTRWTVHFEPDASTPLPDDLIADWLWDEPLEFEFDVDVRN